jgi:hypothetical protein
MKQLKAFFLTLVVIIMLGLVLIVGKGYIKGYLKGEAFNKPASKASTSESSAGSDVVIERSKHANPIKKAVVSEAIDAYISSSDDAQVKEVYDSMSEHDKDIVTDIIADNISLDAITEVQTLVNSGDEDAIQNYAKDKLSDEDQEILLKLMDKYGN